MWSTAALGCGAGDRGLVSCFGLEDHAMENDFDLLMENASHSYGIQYADTKKRSRVGRPFGGDTTAFPRTEVRKPA
jgi:hypothetical protein